MATVNQIQQTLKYTYGLVPIVAGADKFFNLLTHWDGYLSHAFTGMLPMDGPTFMKIVGVIEIVAGLLVLIKPTIGAYVVMAWLIGIALQLIVGGMFFDVAVRDLVMSIGAFSLGRLSQLVEEKEHTSERSTSTARGHHAAHA